MLKNILFFLIVSFLVSHVNAEFVCDIFKRVDPSVFRVSKRNADWLVADHSTTGMDIVCFGEAARNELVLNAIDWINNYVHQTTGQKIKIQEKPATVLPVLYLGYGDKSKQEFEALSNEFKIKHNLGQQGFVIQQINFNNKKVMICWSPTDLGCRYGLIEFLRSLKTVNNSLISDIEHVVDAPDFPIRIHYVNFAEHLQNAYNVNVLFESEINRWNLTDWEQYIDMISFYRYNIFEFWLVPTLLGTSDEMRNSHLHQEFVKTINHVIDYARRRGIAVQSLITNTLGGEWFYACPNDPKEKKQILDAWEFWTKSIHGIYSITIFPGDPGGCIKNGCTKETFIDLALELSRIVRKNSPQTLIEVGTWGEPFAGWGVPLWTADQNIARRSMAYLIEKLPKFPEGTFTSINTGFSPDSDPNQVGGDGRPYAEQASKLVPVLTWDYSVTEGEATVFPHCRLRRMITTRQNELKLGCYSGGICYTMAPQIQCLSAFCSAETWWNPHRTAEEILNDYGQWTFGEGNQEIGCLLEEFEVIPDWGYYAPFPYTAARLYKNMNRLKLLLEKADTVQKPRLPVATNRQQYINSLIFFAELFRDLAEVALSVEALEEAFQKTPFVSEIPRPVSLAAVQNVLTTKNEFEGRNALQSTAERLKNLDVDKLKKRYWKEVYAIYDHIVAPVDPRTGTAMSELLNRFHTSLAIPRKPSVLEKPLRSTGKPFILFPLGGTPIPGWTMSGWDVQGDDGESWSASMTEGTLSCNSFKNEGYKWLVLRIAEGKAGTKKDIWINGQKIGEFVRTGQPNATEWFVTRCFPIPDELLKGESIVIKFTEPGIGIAGVALSVDPLN